MTRSVAVLRAKSEREREAKVDECLQLVREQKALEGRQAELESQLVSALQRQMPRPCAPRGQVGVPRACCSVGRCADAFDGMGAALQQLCGSALSWRVCIDSRVCRRTRSARSRSRASESPHSTTFSLKRSAKPSCCSELGILAKFACRRL